MSDNSKIVTVGYLESYTKSLCNDIVKVTNDIVLNSPHTSSGCEFIDQNSDGLLTFHYKQIDQAALPILESQTNNNVTNIELKGNTTITGKLIASNKLDVYGITKIWNSLSTTGSITTAGNITVNGTTNLKNVSLNDTPTITGNANVGSTLNFDTSQTINSTTTYGTVNLGTNGKIGSGTGNNAYIQNGVIDGFTLQNCTGTGGSEDFIIEVAPNDEWRTMFDKYKITTPNLTFRDIETAITNGERIILKVTDKVTTEYGNISRAIELDQFTSFKGDGTIYEIDDINSPTTDIREVMYVFTKSDKVYESEYSFVLANIDDALCCFPYFGKYCDVDLYLSSFPDTNDHSTFSNIRITINGITNDYDSVDSNKAGLLLYYAIKQNAIVRTRIKNKDFDDPDDPVRIFDFYTQDCRYIRNFNSNPEEHEIVIKYSGNYDSTGPTLKDFYFVIDFIVS